MTILNIIYYGYIFCSVVAGQSHTNFQVERFEKCSESKGIIQFRYINISKTETGQFLNIDFSNAIPLDDKIGINCFIQYAADEKHFLPLFTIREKSICKAANQYLGEFWYDIERAAQITPGICPIPAGRYRVHNLLLDFQRIRLQTFPFGKLRFRFDIMNNGASVSCLLLEVKNVSG